MTEQEFILNIKRANEPKKCSIRNSYTLRDYYRYYNKFHKNLTEKEFALIIKSLFLEVTKRLIKGEDFVLPNRMGCLQVRKMKKKVKIVDGKLRVNLPIDWNNTLKLWYSDESARKKKQLVRCDNPWIFRIFYSKKNANYENKTFFEFRTNRNLKLALRDAIRNNQLDSFTLWRED